MGRLNCIIYSQETEVGEKFTDYIKHFFSMHLIDTFSNHFEMAEKMHRRKADILFINMCDKVEGFNLLNMINKPPFVIGLVHSLDDLPKMLELGFFDCIEIHADAECFCRMMSKIIKIVEHYKPSENDVVGEQTISYTSAKTPTNTLNFVFLKHHREQLRVNHEDIIYVRNIGNTLKVQCTDGKTYYHSSTLKDFLEKLPTNMFCRINQSIIANYNFIDRVANKMVYILGESYKISRIYANSMKINQM